jgi:choline/glycine/proline betaine transport protein
MAEASITFHAKHRLSAFAIFSLVLFSAYAAIDLQAANAVTVAMRDMVTGHFDWLLTGTVSGVLLLALVLLLLPNASRRIGYEHDRPEFSRWSWFSMLFSAGLASGLVYWGTAEPITHFGGNPFVAADATNMQAATTAVTITVFHWGLHGWGLYAITGLCIGLAAYRRGRPITFSAALLPLVGERHVDGLLGRIVDLLALYGTVFGVATSIGLAVGSMNATLEPLSGLPFNMFSQLGIVMVVSTLGVLSVLSGIASGIRRLSELNVWLSLGLLIAIVVAGPTSWLLMAAPANLIDYAANVIPMGFWLADSSADHAWQGAWTVFYWGWWLAWTPFVGMFIARISRGRTIREFILGVLIVPVLVVVTWMTVFGGTALHQELASAGAVSEAVTADYSLGLVATIENLPVPELRTLLLVVVSFLLFTWLITSLDSATLVICHILHFDHMGSMKILWGFLLGGVTCTLMLIGGMQALQAASIIIGLPMAILMLLISISAAKQVIAPPLEQSAAGALR